MGKTWKILHTIRGNTWKQFPCITNVIHKMRKRNWTIFVDLITVIWLIAFFVGLLNRETSITRYCNIINLAILPIFLTDLFFIYRETSSLKVFLKTKWLDILLVIPYFRIFRLLRFARVIRFLKVIRFAKVSRGTKAVKKLNRATEMLKRERV